MAKRIERGQATLPYLQITVGPFAFSHALKVLTYEKSNPINHRTTAPAAAG
jgi:hypothetical protein